MTDFRIEPDSVAELGLRAQRLAGDLERALLAATSEVTSLSGSWNGPAGAAYVRGWQEMHEGGLQVFAALRTLGSSLDVAADVVADHDVATTTSILNLT